MPEIKIDDSRTEMKKICEFCKKEFKKNKGVSYKNFSLKRFCGWECYIKGKVPWNKGVHFVSRGSFKKGKHASPNTEFKKGHKVGNGKKHPSWKGGTRKYYAKVANAIYRKSNINIICEHCGSYNNICIHHKDKNKKNNKINNLQALCVGCHMFLHNKKDGLPFC